MTDGNAIRRVEDGGFVKFMTPKTRHKLWRHGTRHLTGAVPVTATFELAGSWVWSSYLVFDPATQHRVIDLGTGHNLRTGDAIVYENGGGASIGGLTDGNTYYVIVLKDNRVELAASLEDASAGNAVTLTSDGTSSQKLIDHTSTFRAEAVAGASGGDTGVAGSVAINYAKTNTQAVIGLDHGPVGSDTLKLSGADAIRRRI